MTDRLRAAEERERLLHAEKSAREEAEAANRTKDEFLATLSHELRTPLTSILGWARLLRIGKLDDSNREAAVETIERNARLQARLIEDILEISRVITGKVRLRLGPVMLRDVVAASVDVVRPAAAAKNITLKVDYAEQAGPVVGDADRLQQVVWNILANAIKFTPEGGTVEVSLGFQGRHGVIRVTDNGIGISPDFLPHVFERFRQAEGSTTRSHGGLGLGLAIVRYLAELHGGTVTAASEGLGKGSVFTITLPLRVAALDLAAESERTQREGPPLPSEVPSLAGLRVLVVDDEADARDMVAFALRSFGAETQAVASVEEGLAAVRGFAPDVLISDVAMPAQDGFALIRRVRALEDRKLAAVPALALTAFARAEDRARALEAGFQVHLPKPIEPSELAVAVARLAGRG
ncbi:MAG: ATP-binding protein [Myxococcota bacterium]